MGNTALDNGYSFSLCILWTLGTVCFQLCHLVECKNEKTDINLSVIDWEDDDIICTNQCLFCTMKAMASAY